MPSTIESQESAARLHHNLTRLQDSLKEYVHLIELLSTARNRLEAARQNNGDTSVWEAWINEHQSKVDHNRDLAGEAFDEIRKVLGCGPECVCTCEPIKAVKPAKKPAKKVVKKTSRRG